MEHKISLRNKNSSGNRIPIDIELVKWHFDRFLMFNKLKDEIQLSVSDLRKFLAHCAAPGGKARLVTPCSLYYIESRDNPQDILESCLSVCLDQRFVRLEHRAGKWDLFTEEI